MSLEVEGLGFRVPFCHFSWGSSKGLLKGVYKGPTGFGTLFALLAFWGSSKGSVKGSIRGL